MNILLVQYNIDRDQKKPESTINLSVEMKSPRRCVPVGFYIEKYAILAVIREARSMENTVSETDALL